MEDKTYFMAGDIVTLRQDIPNKPTMIVVKKETTVFKKDDNNLKGIRCMWFTTTGEIQEYIYNTKDLIKIK